MIHSSPPLDPFSSPPTPTHRRSLTPLRRDPPIPHSPLNRRPPLPPPPFPLPSPHQERRGRSSRSGDGHDGGQIHDGHSNLSLLATKATRLDATEPISFLPIASLPRKGGLLLLVAFAQPCVHEEMPWTPLVKLCFSDPHQGSCANQHHQLEMQAGRGGRSEGAARRKGKNGMRLRREGLPMDVLLLKAAILDELSSSEEVEQQVQHPLAPCVLFYTAWTSSPTVVSSFPPSVILFYGSIFNNEDMCSHDFGVEEWI